MLPQADADTATKPCPLQDAMPLHALEAVLQSLCPLHLLTPKQCTLALPACAAAPAIVGTTVMLAANAKVAPNANDFFEMLILFFLFICKTII